MKPFITQFESQNATSKPTILTTAHFWSWNGKWRRRGERRRILQKPWYSACYTIEEGVMSQFVISPVLMRISHPVISQFAISNLA
jgi:hypothetical protein